MGDLTAVLNPTTSHACFKNRLSVLCTL